MHDAADYSEIAIDSGHINTDRQNSSVTIERCVSNGAPYYLGCWRCSTMQDRPKPDCRWWRQNHLLCVVALYLGHSAPPFCPIDNDKAFIREYK
jgi:hypothetical protein